MIALPHIHVICTGMYSSPQNWKQLVIIILLFFSCPQGAPLSSLNIVPVCSLQLPPLVPQPDHTVLVRVSSSFLNFCL